MPSLINSQVRLDNHKKMGCDFFEATRVEIPTLTKSGKKPMIEFKNFNRKFKTPVVIYADFETLIQPIDNKHNESKSSTTKLAELPPCSYAFNVVSDYPELNFGLHTYRGEDAVERFITDILKIGDICGDIYKKPKLFGKAKSVKLTEEQEEEIRNCKVCHICERKLGEIDENDDGSKDKTKKEEDFATEVDWDVINGEYLGCAHAKCIRNRRVDIIKNPIPVFFHNLKGFDGHLIIQGLAKMNFSNIRIIAQNFEKYMTITVNQFRFLDSFAFLASSLDTLSSNLLKDGKENFKITLDKIKSENQQRLILKKGVYPYEYMDSFERFEETKLPPIDKFYSQLSESNISKEDYEHAKMVWNIFNMRTLGDYHDLYLMTDVLLLSDVFETFRKTAMKNYNLDPANGYFTLPNFAWDAMMYKTQVKLEQLTDIDMYLFCEK